ncbi:MAG TPA: TIGR00374 family protein, partial [Marinobacter sp.]
MTTNPDQDYKQRASWRRLTIFSLLFIAMTAAGLYAVYDQFAGRSVSFDERLVSPQALISIIALLIVYFSADGLRLHFTLRALGHRL